MVETSLVTGLLSLETIEIGKALLKRLDAGPSAIRAAYWMRLPENQGWSLYLATSKLKTAGPRMLYEEVDRALLQIDTGTGFTKVHLKDIRVVSPQDDTPKSLRALVKTGRTTIASHSFRNATVDGALIADCYVYRSA